jgi:tetratricopeptide (TPR) repeat protein
MNEQTQNSASAPRPAALPAAAGRVDAWAVAALVVAATFLFVPTLGFGLLHGWDDNLYISNNTARLTLSPANLAYWFTHAGAACYLPLTMISYMVDYAFWGLNALGYRLQNLLWHAVATVAFYAFLRSLRLRALPAFLAALLWAIHPQRVESVVWVSERKDVLCAAFTLLALLAYVRSLARGRWPWLALGVFLCAMLSKSMAVSLPVILVAVEWQRFVSLHGLQWPERSAWRPALGRVLPFALISLAFVPVTIFFQVIPADDTTRGHQIGVAVHNLFWYGLRTFVPGRLCPIYPRLEFSGLRVLLLGVAGLASAAVLIRLWRRRPTATAGVVLPALAAYAAALAPVSGIVPLGFVDFSDRYSYIPSMFLWALAAATLQDLLKRFAAGGGQRARTLCLAGAVTLALAYATMSIVTARLWRDIETLNRAACDRDPANVFALGQLGNILLDAESFEEVLVVGDRLAATTGTWMTPAARQRGLLRGLYLRGFALFRLDQVEGAMRAFEAIAPHLEDTVFHEPTNNTAVYAMMAEGYLQRGDQAKALACYTAILGRVPAGSFEWHFYSAVRSLQSGDIAAAQTHFRDADRLKPGNPLVRQNLLRLGAADEAPAAGDAPR